VLGLKIAPRLLASSLLRGSPTRFATIPGALILATGTWHIFRGI
jgi:hypothetical protein